MGTRFAKNDHLYRIYCGFQNPEIPPASAKWTRQPTAGCVADRSVCANYLGKKHIRHDISANASLIRCACSLANERANEGRTLAETWTRLTSAFRLGLTARCQLLKICSLCIYDMCGMRVVCMRVVCGAYAERFARCVPNDPLPCAATQIADYVWISRE